MCSIGREKGRAGGDAKGVSRAAEEARPMPGRRARLDADARSRELLDSHPGRVSPAGCGDPEAGRSIGSGQLLAPHRRARYDGAEARIFG